MTPEKTWTRWHSDGWVLTVIRTPAGEYFYRTQKESEPEAPLVQGLSQVDALHKAEDVVRNSGHRCVARCSFWIADPPDED